MTLKIKSIKHRNRYQRSFFSCRFIMVIVIAATSVYIMFQIWGISSLLKTLKEEKRMDIIEDVASSDGGSSSSSALSKCDDKRTSCESCEAQLEKAKEMMKDILNKSKSLESSPSSEQQPHSKPVVNYRVGTFDASPPSTCDEPNQHFHKTVHTIYGLWSASDDKIPMKDLESWQKWNADWELVIHGREESDALVGSEAFKWLQPIYKKANKIQQADLLRLLFVYEYGGVYTDVDVHVDKSIKETFCHAGFSSTTHTLVAMIEYAFEKDWINGADNALRNGITEINTRIANYVFYASPKSPPLMTIIMNVAARLQRWQSMSEQQRSDDGGYRDYATLYTTGPDAFTEAVFGGPRVTPLNGVLIMNWGDSMHFNNNHVGSWRDKFE